MTQPGVHIVSIDEPESLNQQQQDSSFSGASLAPLRPCPDLIQGDRRDYIKTAIPLYEASSKGDWKSAEEILDIWPELVRYSITENGETALHVAASCKSTKKLEKFVENLMTYMNVKDLELRDNSLNTAVCLAAAVGNVKMVEIMVAKNKTLVTMTGSQRMTPLYMAVLFGHHDVAKYLYDKSDNLTHDCWTPLNRKSLILKCAQTNMFDIALQIVEDRPELDSDGSVLGVLARKTDVFAETQSHILMRTIKWVIYPKVQALEKETKANALKLLTILWKNISGKPTHVIDDILRGPPDRIKHDEKPAFDKEDQTLILLKQISENIVEIPDEIRKIIKERAATTSKKSNQKYAARKYSSRILFVAAEMGNTRFVVELIRQYPDLVWKTNDDRLSIFHVAVIHRHEGIYNILYEIGSKKNLITPLIDRNENNMLHLVAKSVKRKRLEDVSGGAFQMQRELLWFKEVEEMIPFSYRERKNKDGLTPRELFTIEHEDLVKQGEEWMKATASQCMVVAALIATIVFAAAFTVPGGYNQYDGIPFFYKNVSFVIFVVADAMSLFSSSASILTFLSILTSRYAEWDFYQSLPRKLTLGLATLYLSITTMMVTFSVSFFVLYNKDLKWIPILVSLIATMPVLLFAMLQYRLLKDVIYSTYGSRYIFRPEKPALYYEYTTNSCRRCFPFTIPFISICTSKISKLL